MQMYRISGCFFMKFKDWRYEDGKMTIHLVDKESKPLGLFIVSDFELIKSLRKNNLNKIELIFKEAENEPLQQ